MKYKAAVLVAPGRIEIQQKAVGRLAVGEVLIEILAAGVCGTDVSIYRGDYKIPLPLVLGHEFVGRLVDAPAASPVRCWIGRPVVCEINNSCIAYGRRALCAACKRGLPTHCLRRTVTGIISHPGAFAEFLKAPVGNIHALPKGFPIEAAILVEPLAAAIRTFELTPIRGGETVVVLGCGRLGRLTALVASNLGARVVAIGHSSAHLDLIRPFAWKRIARSRDSNNGKLVAQVKDLTAGLGADIVVEATAANDNLVLAQQLVRPRGVVAMKSTSGVQVAGFDTTKTAVDEITLQGSRCGPFDKAIAFMKKHQLPNASWITARFPFAQTQAAIESASREPKVMIDVELSA